MHEPENLAQLVTRLRTQKWRSRRDADRKSGIPYATWQNVEHRGTIPTLATLTKLAAALDIPEQDILNAARVSQVGRERAMSPPMVEEATAPVSRRHRAPGKPPGTGSKPRDRRAE